MYVLTDDYQETGTKLEEFAEKCNEIDEATSFISVDTEDINLLTLVPEKCTENELIFYQHIPGEKQTPLRKLEVKKLQAKGVDEETINELRNNKMMLLAGGNTYFTSASLVTSIASRAKLSGSRLKKPSYARNAYFAEIFHEDGIPVKLLARTDGKAKKIFAVHSAKYGVVRQTILPEILWQIEHGLGDPVVKNWSISQELTNIVVTFPEKAEDVAATYHLPDKLVPVLYLGTSDTGDSAITCLGGWMTPSGTVSYESVYKRVHKTAYMADSKNKAVINPEDIIERINENIFDNYTRLPDRLCELMAIPVDDVMAAYDAVIKFTGLAKVLGQKGKKSLLDQLEMELTPGLKYTAYNVAMTFLSLPERLKSSNPDIDINIRQLCGKAPYANYKTIGRKKEEPVLVLTA